jgi:hypothetical protein
MSAKNLSDIDQKKFRKNKLSSCRYCHKQITFNSNVRSPNGKLIPLNPDRNKHDCNQSPYGKYKQEQEDRISNQQISYLESELSILLCRVMQLEKSAKSIGKVISTKKEQNLTNSSKNYSKYEAYIQQDLTKNGKEVNTSNKDLAKQPEKRSD